jgi:RNA polymerase sigma-70 factor (ECF subfamily)
LRQVFDYGYEEIARIVGKSEHSCRQLVYRAKQHLASQRPRYEVSSQQQEQFYQSFLQASANGSMEDLLHLLAEDVVLYSDGGELRRPMPLNGAEVVARYMLEVTRRVSLETDWHGQVAMINGRPGVVISAYGRLYAVLTIELVDGRIQEIDFIVNPEKLGHLRQSTGNS